MNFLAHLHLCQHLSTMEAAGNLAADVCKTEGNEAFRRGVMVHRRIDAFTDTHELTAKARALFPGSYRRFGGVLSDLMFDHCLARGWESWSNHETVGSFVKPQLALMLGESDSLPKDATLVITRMQRGQWLQSYESIGGVRVAIERMATRRPVATGMLGAETVMRERSEEFFSLFQAFYPQLKSHVREELSIA